LQAVFEQKAFNVGGEVQVFGEGEFPTRYAGVYMRPSDARNEFARRRWKTVAALQLRNPMHRAHEYLAKVGVEVCDGLFIHSLVGGVKAGDIPADVRVRCIEAHVRGYFAGQHVVHGGYPLDMRYAGPREALLHAVFRQNYGCTHLLVGRDHAGVGNYYGVFDAQRIFERIPVPADPAKALQCRPLCVDWAFYCTRCDGPASLRTCPHDKEDRVVVSGTMVRKLLSEGKDLPAHFSRPEVIAILRDYYRSLSQAERVEIKLNRVSKMAPGK
jgi:sulfate adenylyltransferase